MERACAEQFGVETDIRDYAEKLCISHDVATPSAYSMNRLLALYQNATPTACLALNIKADGLSKLLKEALAEFNISNYFVFDMSIPETLRYLELQMPVFIRMSEYESPHPKLLEKSAGVWLDAFDGVWYNKETINLLLQSGKKVAIVSAELHGRNQDEQWNMIRSHEWHQSSQVYLCTDFPDLAKTFFKLHD
jgi:hypothetical protein